MYMDSEKFENWMERIMERFDRTEKLLAVSYTHLTLPTN